MDNESIFLTDEGFVFYNDGEINVLLEYVGHGATVLVLPDSFMNMPYTMVDKVFADFYVSGWDTMDMFDIESWSVPICHSGSLVQTVVIPTCINQIPAYAFAGWGALEYVFYAGDADQWEGVELNVNIATECNVELLDAKVAFYSESTPVTEDIFWHYVNGVPVLW